MTTATMYRVDEGGEMTHSSPSDEPSEISGSVLPSSFEGMELRPAGWLPRDQEYYWSAGWQAGERKTLEEIAAGEGIDFDNAADLLHWLFSTDDD